MTDPRPTKEEARPTLFPCVSLSRISLPEANDLLTEFGHRIGTINRPDQRDGWCHALFDADIPVAVAVSSYLIRPTAGGIEWLNRDNTIELSRLCAKRSGICRVMLRLWREFVFPELGFDWAISYQDSQLHTGNTYRFDGWRRVAYSSSGTDSRSGRKGRSKWIWVWPTPDTRTVAEE